MEENQIIAHINIQTMLLASTQNYDDFCFVACCCFLLQQQKNSQYGADTGERWASSIMYKKKEKKN